MPRLRTALPPCSRFRGFSLTEVMVILAIFGLVAGTAFWFYRQRTAEGGRAGRRDVFQQESLRLLSSLRQDCRSARHMAELDNGLSLSVVQAGAAGVDIQRVDYLSSAQQVVRVASGETQAFTFIPSEASGDKLHVTFTCPDPDRPIVNIGLQGRDAGGVTFVSLDETLRAVNIPAAGETSEESP